MRKLLRKLDKNIFFCYFVRMPQRLCLFIYEVIVCSLLCNLLYQVSHFSVSMEHLKLRKQKLSELLSMDQQTAPLMTHDFAFFSCKPTEK